MAINPTTITAMLIQRIGLEGVTYSVCFRGDNREQQVPVSGRRFWQLMERANLVMVEPGYWTQDGEVTR